MKNIFIIGIAMLLSFFSYGQISGDIVKDGRKLIDEGSYTMEGSATGTITFRISVNEHGVISSATVINKESTVKSTPIAIKARNYIVAHFKFEPGTWFPKYHQGILTLTIKEKED